MPSPPGFTTVIDNLVHPPLGFLVERVIDGSPFIGDGTLFRSHGPIGVWAWGIAWSFVVVPQYLGQTRGGVPMFQQRMLQLATYHGSRDTLHVGEVIDIHYDSGVWMWGGAFPDMVQYSLLPGVQAQFRWLLFTLP